MSKQVTIYKRYIVCIKKITKHCQDILEWVPHDTKTQITHNIYLPGISMNDWQDGIESFNQELGIMVWFGSAKAVNRPSNSRAIIIKNKAYSVMTWTDVAGPQHGRRNSLFKIINKDTVNFVRVMDRNHSKIIVDAMYKSNIGKKLV